MCLRKLFSRLIICRSKNLLLYGMAMYMFVIFCVLINYRYDPICSHRRCNFRKRSFFENNFFKKCLSHDLLKSDEYFEFCNIHDKPFSVRPCTTSTSFTVKPNIFSMSVYGTNSRY
eukprot:UN22638